MKEGKAEDYRLDEQGTVWLKEWICVPQDKALLEQIMREANARGTRFTLEAQRCTKI
jgi:hypothetical protein